jgi:hypothetical protein
MSGVVFVLFRDRGCRILKGFARALGYGEAMGAKRDDKVHSHPEGMTGTKGPPAPKTAAAKGLAAKGLADRLTGIPGIEAVFERVSTWREDPVLMPHMAHVHAMLLSLRRRAAAASCWSPTRRAAANAGNSSPTSSPT